MAQQKRTKTKSKTTAPVDAYAEVTARLLAVMEQGQLPWVRRWSVQAGPSLGLPLNGSSGNTYRGINILTLWSGAWSSARWFSYRQAQTLGGQVRRGEKGAKILFFRMLEKENAETGEVDEIPMARLSSVFNEEQIDWGDEGAPEAIEHVYPDAQVVLQKSGADIRTGGSRAFYSTSEDYIRLPAFEAFESEGFYWATALHELVHWTGAAHRLDRTFGAKGTEAYAFEELVAEMGAAFLCAQLGLPPIDRHAGAYLQHWMTQGKQDKRAFARAATLAQKAADYILDMAEAVRPTRRAA